MALSRSGYIGVQHCLRCGWHSKRHDVRPFFFCISTVPSPTGLASAMIWVYASLSKYAKTGALAICRFNFWNDFSCSPPQINDSPCLAIFLRGSAVVENSGMNLALNPTKLKQLRTSDGDYGWEASTTALAFSLVGPIPCLVKRRPMKTTFVILKVHFSALTVSPLSLSLSNTLIKFLSCSSESFPCTTRSFAILATPFRPAIVWVTICWYFSGAALTPKLNRLYRKIP